MKVLNLRWQRLVDGKGQTCDRCGATEKALEEAVGKLKDSLTGLGIGVVLEKSAMSDVELSKDMLQSNRIWIDGKPIEEWLSATTGQSACCGVCGDSDCRTIEVDGNSFEAVPADLIVKAGLIAGAQLISGKPAKTCCAPTDRRVDDLPIRVAVHRDPRQLYQDPPLF